VGQDFPLSEQNTSFVVSLAVLQNPDLSHAS
jgi:hypothetical protein